MKKIILAVLVLMGTLGPVSAQNGPPAAQRGTNKNCPGFVDVNKDGICDNLGTAKCMYNNGLGRGQGRMGMGMGRGTGNCNGQGVRNGTGRGVNGMRGRYFVDANNNGTCDRFENTPKK